MLSIMSVNWISVILAVIAAFIIGMVWYHPKVFGNAWMKEMKIDPKKRMAEMKKGMARGMVLMVISSFITATILSVIISATGAISLAQGLQVGFWLWVGFYAAALLAGIAFEGMSTRLYLIKAGNTLVTILVMAAILVTWA